MESKSGKLRSYEDLDVYQRAYKAALKVMIEIVPKLPDIEKYDLKCQLSRSSKAVPRLIAEGYAKKHQKAGFQKYLDDALSESNETQVGLCQARDLYSVHVDPAICKELINEFEITARQIFRLKEAWTKFANQTKPDNNK